jgi:tetratricopeptide (TPR) repeat protein
VFILLFLILFWRTELYIPSGKDTLTRNIYMAQEAPDWNRHNWIAKSIDLAEQENRKQELPEWINEKTFENEINNWLDKYLDLKTSLSIKYGPYQMPYNFYVYRGIFKFLYFSNDFLRLNKAMNALLSVNNHWIGWYELARFFNRLNKPQDAWEAIKRAINSNPKMKHSFDEQFIEVAIKVQKIDEAKLLMDEYIKYFPQSAFPYLFAGTFYSRVGEKEKTLEYFLKAIKPDKYPSINDGKLYNYAAEFFWKEGYEEETINTINIVLSFDPENKVAKGELAKINLLKKNANSLGN